MSFVNGMISLLGHDPGRMIGILPKGWGLIYRGVCEPSSDRRAKGQVVLRFERVATQVRASPNYFHSWHGTCLGMADLARMEGSVVFVVAEDRSSATATFTWPTET